ncbi:RidA family protein [Asticcacaulis sp. ZE23SCel15]|uniref:RidA family protein n=1 Tax=Asticcacaulis sp. ZE23SCel15 TaxID=3059027 RepID=UPI00265FF79F|nr:RidA family protein [Asticcacaulis sp. ZE23SCel15]WKL57026.1 RidA family protein [Asticcacaulis sp. ZE23SCel15]
MAPTSTTDITHFAYDFDLPASEAVSTGGLLYLSGHIGDDDDGNVPDTLAEQTEQMMRNVAASLKTVGASFDDVFKCRLMLTDMTRLDEVFEIYRLYFKPLCLPVCTTFGVSALAYGAQVEIEVSLKNVK